MCKDIGIAIVATGNNPKRKTSPLYPSTDSRWALLKI
jgi:hypothetical protein